MSIADIINGTSATSGTTATTRKTTKDQLGQTEFLKLMVAQLQNQDPFKAMDPSQFLGQLAQFGTVSGIQQMQNAFTTLSDSMRGSQVLDGATMVGRGVLVAQSDVQLGATDTVSGSVDVPSGASAVQLNITDSTGQLVRTLPLPTTTGSNDFSWDGTDDVGDRAPAGEYSLQIVANVGGANQSLTPLVATRVSSVTIDPNGAGLVLNTPSLGSVSLADVRRVM